MNSSTGNERRSKSGDDEGSSPSESVLPTSDQARDGDAENTESVSPLSLSSARALVSEATTFSQGYRLTPRESEIVVVLAEGVTRIKDIADRLRLSPNTVNNHVNSIFMKTKARSKSQLLAMLLGRISLELQSARIFRKRPRVALLTKNEHISHPLISAMKDNNISVEHFDSPSEFLKALNETRPHFVVADLSVDETGARQLLEKLGSQEKPRLVLVGKSDAISTRWQAMEAGAIDLFDTAAEPMRLVNVLLGHYIENDADRARFISYAKGSQAEPLKAQDITRISQQALGRGGVFLAAEEVERSFARALQVGDLLDLRLSVEGLERPFRAQGEVVWVRDEGSPKVAGVGVRLLHLIDASEMERESWRKYVRRHSTKSYIPTGNQDPS